jgi:hypothetical protein
MYEWIPKLYNLTPLHQAQMNLAEIAMGHVCGLTSKVFWNEDNFFKCVAEPTTAA